MSMNPKREIFANLAKIGTALSSPVRIELLEVLAQRERRVDQLASLNGCTVKVSLDGRRTRLHAKAWIFRRRSGFGAAYVGSANLSGAALLGGLEWTVKFTEHGQQSLYTRAQAHFDSLWADDEFEAYDPQRESIRLALRWDGPIILN